ncbi:hypothetical protein CDL12_21858 [Handroanthus impetiginosus]|uniref:Uncharacterized protein n=1 Tax=Handroanthus impetiginosus TaxID=429701 RepID=A0A2G9GKQ2_9LAMI|nr:hypothetical protein CDL12_21858 [Handroanthus impetiginosus]
MVISEFIFANMKFLVNLKCLANEGDSPEIVLLVSKFFWKQGVRCEGDRGLKGTRWLRSKIRLLNHIIVSTQCDIFMCSECSKNMIFCDKSLLTVLQAQG